MTRYLARAFGFEDGFLLLLNRETGTLEGTWTRARAGASTALELELPLVGDDRRGRARAVAQPHVVVHDPAAATRRELLPGRPSAPGGARRPRLDRLRAAPAQPHAAAGGEPHELCGAALHPGRRPLLAPPPGQPAPSLGRRARGAPAPLHGLRADAACSA